MSTPGLREPGAGFTPQVIKGDFRPSFQGAVTPANAASALSLPLYGKIAAGTPIEALRDNTSSIDVPTSLLGQGTHYCLEVEGDSMVEAGILDGDYVVVRQQPDADPGEVVVAGIPGEEATVKTYLRRRGKVVLRPENPTMSEMIFEPEDVSIYGKVVTLLRRLN
jgi:repressor LexA